MVIQRKKLADWITAGRVALASRTTGVPPILLESTSKVDILDKNLKGIP